LISSSGRPTPYSSSVARDSPDPVTALLRNSVLASDGIALALAVAVAGTAALVLALAIRPVRLRAVSLSWLENGGEFRQAAVPVAPEYQSVPIVSMVEPAAAGGQLTREFSGAINVADVKLARPLTGVYRVPAGVRARSSRGPEPPT